MKEFTMLIQQLIGLFCSMMVISKNMFPILGIILFIVNFTYCFYWISKVIKNINKELDS